MIRNERQYRVSQSQRDKMSIELTQLDLSNDPEWVIQASKAAVLSQIGDLDVELAEYEALQVQEAEFAVSDLSALPRELVRARIARRLSQKELATELGLKEQQIQRYEASDYGGASVGRLGEVMGALGVRLTGELDLVGGDRELDRVKRALTDVGLSSQTIRSRFFAAGSVNRGSWSNAAARAARVYRVTVDDVLSGSLEKSLTGAYRANPSANREKLTGYAVYAQYLAELVARSCSTPYRPLPAWRELREELGDRLTTDPLGALLEVCWDHGVPVIPLSDSGTFYGACWFFGDRPAIVLKNRVRTPERWAFLLAHEMEHTRHPDEESVLESDLGVSAWRDRPEEREADKNATRLLLGESAEAMAQVAVEMASHNATRLKAAVQDVAQAQDVRVGLLADYVAWRVSESDGSWWATANGLHSSNEDAWLTTRGELFARLQLGRLDSLDRDILIDGMAP